MILDQVKILLQQKKMTVAELERKLNFSQGSMSRWNKTVPGSDKLKKVADYFNVSTDYLLGREVKSDSHTVDLADNESYLFYDGRQITSEERALITAIIETHRKNKE